MNKYYLYTLKLIKYIYKKNKLNKKFLIYFFLIILKIFESIFNKSHSNTAKFLELLKQLSLLLLKLKIKKNIIYQLFLFIKHNKRK